MAESDHGIKMITDTTGRELARVAGVECQRLQPIEVAQAVSSGRRNHRLQQ